MTPERLAEIEAYLAPGVERDLYTLRTVAVELLRDVKRLRTGLEYLADRQVFDPETVQTAQGILEGK